MTTNDKLDDIGDPIYTDNNPFKKLMEGFCSPKKSSGDFNDDDDDIDNIDNDRDAYHDDGYHRIVDKYAPDLTPANAKQPTPPPPHNHSIGDNEEMKEEPPAAELLDNDGAITAAPPKVRSKQPDADSKSVRSELKIDDHTTTGDTMLKTSTASRSTKSSSSIGTDATGDTETIKQQYRNEKFSPATDVSERVTMMRRKRGIENVIMACIFVLTTLLTLKKLGFTTSDFDFMRIVGGGSNDKSWIQIFDKQKVTVPLSKNIKTETEEITETEESDDVNEEEISGTEDDDEDYYYYNSITSSETEDEL